ncbi:MAG: hypothetical protein MJ187_03675 [Alphaproteobacteria bacterium]|nr:hypothetical protein [Alphaproteobacteria bacterium]
MLIDNFINLQNNSVDTARGGNKKCFLFDDYALLHGNFKETDLKQQIIIGNKLKNDGVNICPILEYRIDGPIDNFGYVSGYTLQPRAIGDCLYRHNMQITEYKKRLKQIAQMDLKFLDKFISDWFAITNSGLMIDPSKCENFFYSDNGICFIDLNVKHRVYPLKTAFTEIISVLTGLGLIYRGTDVNDCMQIIKNTSRLFWARGLVLTDIRDIISHRFDTVLTDKQIDLIIGTLTTENKTDNRSVISLQNTGMDITGR